MICCEVPSSISTVCDSASKKNNKKNECKYKYTYLHYITLHYMSNNNNITTTTDAVAANETNTPQLCYAVMAGGSDEPVSVVESWEDIKPVERQQQQRQPPRHAETRGDKYSSERFQAWGEQHTRPLRLQDSCIFTHGEDGIWLVSSDFGKYEWTEVDNAMVPFNGTLMQWVYFRDLMHKKRINFEGEIIMRTIDAMCGPNVLLQRPPQRRRGGYRGGSQRRRGGGERYGRERGGERYGREREQYQPRTILSRQQEYLNFNREEFPSLA